MNQGYERLYKNISEFTYIYKYKDGYFSAKDIKKLTKDIWIADYRTKDKILANPERWAELLKFGVDAVICEDLAAMHCITPEGEILRRSTLTIVGSKNTGKAIFQENGVIYDSFYRASLVYKKFIDPAFDIENQECWFLDGDYTNATIYNLMAKDKTGDSSAAIKKAKKNKKGRINKIKEEQEYSY